MGIFSVVRKIFSRGAVKKIKKKFLSKKISLNTYFEVIDYLKKYD